MKDPETEPFKSRETAMDIMVDLANQIREKCVRVRDPAVPTRVGVRARRSHECARGARAPSLGTAESVVQGPGV